MNRLVSRETDHLEGSGGQHPFYSVAHAQVDYFLRPSAPPLEDEEDDYADDAEFAPARDWRRQEVELDSSSDEEDDGAEELEGAEMEEFRVDQGSDSSSGSSTDQMDNEDDDQHNLVSSPRDDKKKSKGSTAHSLWDYSTDKSLIKGKKAKGSKLCDDADKSLESAGRPKPKGKNRMTEERRRFRHKLREKNEAKELTGWQRCVCTLWRWNQKRAKSTREPTVYRPYFIIVISIINVILMITEIGVNKGIESMSTNPMVGPSAETLLDMGAKYSPYMTTASGAWRFIVPMFLHVGIIHLLFNLCSQLQMVMVERSYGCHRILPIYFLAGVAGNLSSAIFVPNQIMVGASGAIFGLVGVIGVDLLQNWKRIKCPIVQIVVWVISVVISLAFGLLPGIDNFCHIGGFVQGIIGACIFLPIVGRDNASGKGRWALAMVCIPLDIALFVAGFLVFYLVIAAHPSNLHGWCHFCSWIDCVPIGNWCDSYNN